MANDHQIASNIDDASAVLTSRVATDGDEFRIRILRRSSSGTPPETIAVIDGATIEQVFNPESWLSLLAGGSPHYTFQVMHVKDKAAGLYNAIFSIPAIGGDPLPPNPRVTALPEWPQNMKLHFVPGQRTIREGANGKMVGAPSHEAMPLSSAISGGGGSDLLLALQREREALAEQRHRMELDAVRREAEMSQKAIESRISMIATRPQFDMAEFVAKIGATFVPVVTALIASTQARRDADTRSEEIRAQREAERDAKRQDRESSLMEKIATQSSESAKVIGVFTESLSTVARSMVQTVAMVGELRQEPQEDTSFAGIAKAAITAWVESTARQAAPRPLPIQQPRLVPAPPPPPPQQAPSSPAEPETEEVEMSADEMLGVLAGEVGLHADTNDLAESIVEALQSPEFIAQIQGEGGIVAALRSRLGEQWADVPDNIAYIQRLFAAVGQRAKAAGVDASALLQQPAA